MIKIIKFQCPICSKEIIWKDNIWRPFCSHYCKLIDLEEWLNEVKCLSIVTDGTNNLN
ncbi:MAG: DNA gyrase inhibitor YacG [Candidatus Dasytiphilus stammeri]